MNIRIALFAAAFSPTLVLAAPPMDALNKYACAGCHGMTTKIVGPGFNEIAAKYQGQKDAKATLAASIKAGGSGKWGQIPMPPQPGVTDAEMTVIVDWLLAGAKP